MMGTGREETWWRRCGLQLDPIAWIHTIYLLPSQTIQSARKKDIFDALLCHFSPGRKPHFGGK
jgi:hypothetical protein